MSLTLTIVMMIAAWLTVAAAMLWGVLRIARRHPPPPRPRTPVRHEADSLVGPSPPGKTSLR